MSSCIPDEVFRDFHPESESELLLVTRLNDNHLPRSVVGKLATSPHKRDIRSGYLLLIRGGVRPRACRQGVLLTSLH